MSYAGKYLAFSRYIPAPTNLWSSFTNRVLEHDFKIGFDAHPYKPYLQGVAEAGGGYLIIDNSDGDWTPETYYNTNFSTNTQIRISWGDGVNTYRLFYGYVAAMMPESGQYRSKRLRLEIRDYLEVADLYDVTLDETHFGTLRTVAEELEDYFLADLPSEGFDIGDNSDNFDIYAWPWPAEGYSLRKALGDICRSFWGRLHVNGDGEWVYTTREQFGVVAANAVAAFDDEPQAKLIVGHRIEDIVNRCAVVIQPPDYVGSTVVLWKANSAVTVPKSSTRVVSMPFRDPDTGSRCGGDTVTTPVANTDYKINTARDGSGSDITLSGTMTLTWTVEEKRMVLEVSNSSLTHSAYFVDGSGNPTLQVRGQPVIQLDPLMLIEEDSGSLAEWYRRYLELKLLIQDDVLASDIGYMLVQTLAYPISYAREMWIRVGTTPSGVNPYSLKILDVVGITETQSELNDTLHRIIAIRYTDQHVILYFEPVDRLEEDILTGDARLERFLE